MKELEVGGQGCIEGCFLIKGTFSTFRYNRHRQLLLPHLPQGTLDMNHGRGTKETFLAPIGFLGNSGMQTDDGCHGYDSAAVLGNLFTHNASDFSVITLRI